MRITLNGQEQNFSAPLTIAELVEKLELEAEKIAIDCNAEVIARNAYVKTHLQEGDTVEIIHFIGGG